MTLRRRLTLVSLATGVALSVGTLTAGSASAFVWNPLQECLWSDANMTGLTWRGQDTNQYNYGQSWYINSGKTKLWSGDGVHSNVSSADSEDYGRFTTFYYNSQLRGACWRTQYMGQAVYSFTSVRLSGSPGAGVANDRLGSHSFARSC
jgi:hypothetical protein